MIAVVAAALLAQAPGAVIGLKPWDPRSIHGKQSRAVFELNFQPVRDSPPYRLAGLDVYDREKMDDALLLGDVLFHAPQLLGPRSAWFGLSCATCHPGGATHNTFFVEAQSDRPGNVDLLSDYFYAEADDGVFAPRNITSLRGCASSAPYRRDGTVAALDEANALVVRHEFQQHVPDAWLAALSAYVARFELLPNAQLDAAGALTEKASDLARQGERVFDARGCARCHVKATGFSDRARHPERHGEGQGDAFDTPGLLGISETAPYFFDGSATTLAAAVDAIDRKSALQLSKPDRAALVAYLEAVGAVDVPRQTWPPAERVRQALAWGRLAQATADPALWALVLDAMRFQVRLAGHTPPLVQLASDLEALAKGPCSDAAKRKLKSLLIGHRAGKRD